MEFLLDPTIWVGLLTLVVLEIVLGIDNLVFIAIIAKKLPASQQDKALYVGLGLALAMRLGLLSIMSWLVALTDPVFSVWGHAFSFRDLILLGGGLFLLFKATTELHERLEALVQLGRGLEEQEEAAAQKDQVPERERVSPDREDGVGEGHEPRHDGEKAQTHRERKSEAHVEGLVLL